MKRMTLKRVVSVLLCLTVLVLTAGVLSGCEKEPTPSPTPTPNPSDNFDVVITSNTESAKAGETITFSVYLGGSRALSGIKSIGVRAVFDETKFKVVSGKMSVTGNLSNFSDGIGVVAFDNALSIESRTKVAEFKLQVIEGANVGNEEIDYEISVIDASGNSLSLNLGNAAPVRIEQ